MVLDYNTTTEYYYKFFWHVYQTINQLVEKNDCHTIHVRKNIKAISVVFR